jgi:hypothetical protein
MRITCGIDWAEAHHDAVKRIPRRLYSGAMQEQAAAVEPAPPPDL